MPIAKVEAIPLEMEVTPLSEDWGLAPYRSNHAAVESVTRVLVRLETTDGLVGWGEMLATLSSAEATVTVLEEVIGPEVVGRPVGDIQSFVESFYFPYVKVQPYIGAVEMALWDLLGKRHGAPVHALLGGATTDRVSMAYCVGMLPPEESRAHARKAHDAGYPALKTKAGPDWREDVDRLVAMADEVDGDLEFRLDPNQGWSFEDAIRAGAALEDAGVYLQYLEQPVEIDTYGTYRSLRTRLRTPIAVNEDTYFRRNLYNLLREDAIDVAVVDIVPAGGILRMKGLAGMAAEAGVSLSHHNGFDLGVKTAAVLHAVATTPAITLPPDTVYYAWEDAIIENPFEVIDGAMAVRDDPGLGVTVDETAVERFRTDR
ncbi:mandelate racemase/muconate lactonizing enzyme family protein [Halobacteriaceae archaeon GCM10025711]